MHTLRGSTEMLTTPLFDSRPMHILCFCRSHCLIFFICPIAIAYSMGQIIKSVCVCVSVCLCVCVSVCLSVCEHSHGRIS